MSNPTEFLSRTGYRLVTASINAPITFTGDVTGAGLTPIAMTLATVNSNVGSFGSSTAIPSFTVNGKGLITAASTNAVIAPAGTLTGTTLASNVVTSSLTSVGTLTNLTVTNPITGSVTGNAGTATALQTARTIDGQSFDGTANITVIAPGTHAASSKTTPVDADEIPLADSAASFILKKLTWANIKSTLKTYFDTLYAPLTNTFTSSQQTITSAGSLTLAHGLAARPNLILAYLICTVTNNGFAVNDVILIAADSESGTNTGAAIWADSTNINVRYGSSAQVFQYINKTTGIRNALTNADWNFFVVAKVI